MSAYEIMAKTLKENNLTDFLICKKLPTYQSNKAWRECCQRMIAADIPLLARMDTLRPGMFYPLPGTPRPFAQALQELGITYSWAAQVIGVRPQQLRKWVAEVNAPTPAMQQELEAILGMVVWKSTARTRKVKSLKTFVQDNGLWDTYLEYMEKA